MRALVEHLQLVSGTAYVLVRMNGPGVTLGDDATLGGVPIRRWVEQPRKLRGDGKPDFEVWAFALQDANDLGKFTIGMVAELKQW